MGSTSIIIIPQEYENHYQAQDEISQFIGYYNHRRPHQGIGFAGSYQKLTGQAKRIIKERRTRALAAQKIRKIENRRKINPSINEEMTSVKNRVKKNFGLGPKGSETLQKSYRR